MLPFSYASYPLDPVQRQAVRLQSELSGLFQVSEVHLRGPGDEEIAFSGRFLERDGGYAELEQRFHVHGYTPLLRRRDGQDLLLALKGIVRQEGTGNPLLNVLLLLVTVLTTLSAGAGMAGREGLFASLAQGDAAGAAAAALAGAPFALTLLGILGVHELGHYVAARWHRVAATLPYFIPMPVGGLGTLGAFISVRSPMKNRTVLFDIGLAGPLAGLVVALPLFVWGLYLSQPVPHFSPGLTLQLLGSSVLVKTLSGLMLDLQPGQTLAVHPVFFAAWFGILITGINLLPIGQLDGGHVAYGLLGHAAHHLARGTLLLLLAAGAILSSIWFIWALFALFGGLHHPPPLDDISGLSLRRKVIGLLTVALFILIITPVPFR